MDIYGADQTVNVNIGTEEQLREQNKVTSGCIASKHKFVAWTKLKQMCHKKTLNMCKAQALMYQCIAVRFNSISSPHNTYTAYVHAYTLCTYNIRERGSVLYLGMAMEFLNLPWLCITQIMAKQATNPKASIQFD